MIGDLHVRNKTLRTILCYYNYYYTVAYPTGVRKNDFAIQLVGTGQQLFRCQ